MLRLKFEYKFKTRAFLIAQHLQHNLLNFQIILSNRKKGIENLGKDIDARS